MKNEIEIVDSNNDQVASLPSVNAAIAAARILCKEYNAKLKVRTLKTGAELYAFEPVYTVKMYSVSKDDKPAKESRY